MAPPQKQLPESELRLRDPQTISRVSPPLLKELGLLSAVSVRSQNIGHLAVSDVTCIRPGYKLEFLYISQPGGEPSRTIAMVAAGRPGTEVAVRFRNILSTECTEVKGKFYKSHDA